MTAPISPRTFLLQSARDPQTHTIRLVSGRQVWEKDMSQFPSNERIEIAQNLFRQVHQEANKSSLGSIADLSNCPEIPPETPGFDLVATVFNSNGKQVTSQDWVLACMKEEKLRTVLKERKEHLRATSKVAKKILQDAREAINALNRRSLGEDKDTFFFNSRLLFGIFLQHSWNADKELAQICEQNQKTSK